MDTCDVGQILLDNASFSNPYFLFGVAGSALWSVAYVLFVRQGIKDRTCTLPMVAICLNFTWEVMAVVFLEDPIKAWTYLEYSWLAIDVFLLGLLIKFGRQSQSIPEIRKHFYPVLLGTLVLAFIGQHTFVSFFNDSLAFIDAFIINLIMSILFVFMYFDRRDDLRGLSYGAAWLKMLGTAGTSIQCYVLIPKVRCEDTNSAFMTFLYVSIFIFDAIYVALLTKRRRELAATRQ